MGRLTSRSAAAPPEMQSHAHEATKVLVAFLLFAAPCACHAQGGMERMSDGIYEHRMDLMPQRWSDGEAIIAAEQPHQRSLLGKPKRAWIPNLRLGERSSEGNWLYRGVRTWPLM